MLLRCLKKSLQKRAFNWFKLGQDFFSKGTGYFFEIDCGIFYTNLHESFCQFISWTNWVNSGNFRDNCWISCLVMADMEKYCEDLIIINLSFFECNFWISDPCDWRLPHRKIHSLDPSWVSRDTVVLMSSNDTQQKKW